MAPVLHFAPELLLAAQDVRVVFFDVDGILTSGTVDGMEQDMTYRRFNVLDRHGLMLLRQSGITPVLLTTPKPNPLQAQLSMFGIDLVHYYTDNKLLAAEQWLTTSGFDWTQAAGIGHDWPDLPVLTRCALVVAPANAHVEVRAIANFVTLARGGEGAVREVCDLLLTASGRYAGALTAALQGPPA